MAVLTTLATSKIDEKGSNDAANRTVSATVDVGKTLALMILAVVLFVFAFVLFLQNDEGAAGAASGFMAAGTAILTGGFGIVIGENRVQRTQPTSSRRP